jgi:hypothetical protein
MRGVAPSKDKKNPKYFLDNKLIIGSKCTNFRGSNFRGSSSIKSTINNTL